MYICLYVFMFICIFMYTCTFVSLYECIIWVNMYVLVAVNVAG